MGLEVVYRISPSQTKYSDGGSHSYVGIQRYVDIVVSDKKDDDNYHMYRMDKKTLMDKGIKDNIDILLSRTYDTITNFLNNTGFKKQDFYEAPNGADYDRVSATFKVFKKHFIYPRPCFERYMGDDLEPEDTDLMLLNIYLTITGLLQKSVLIKPYVPIENWFGSVASRGALRTDPESKIKQFCNEYRAQIMDPRKARRNIHLNYNRIREYPLDLAVMTLLHEASHKFADTEDHAYFLNDKNVTTYYKDGKLYQAKIDGKLSSKVVELPDAGVKYKIPLYNIKGYNTEVDPNQNYKLFKAINAHDAANNADTVAAIIYHYGNGGGIPKMSLKSLSIS